MASTASLYKFSGIEEQRQKVRALWISTFFHTLIFGLGAAIVIFNPRLPENEVEIDVIVNPKQSPMAVSHPIRPRAEPQRPPVAKQVFGQSRKTITSDAGVDLNVKAGNTIAKAVDQEKLNPNDPDPIPVPADEFLVTQMPKLVTDVRVPYPKVAKEAGVQGTVLLDLLIDSKGKVREVLALDGPGHGLNEAAMEAARGFQFEPARVQNQPVAVKIRYAYRFVLEK